MNDKINYSYNLINGCIWIAILKDYFGKEKVFKILTLYEIILIL